VLHAAARVEWGLRRHSLPATAGALGVGLFAGGAPSDGAPSSPDRLELPAWAWRRTRIALVIMRRWPFGDTCLRRALVIGNRLAPLAPELVIGVRPAAAPRGIQAHAWLRIDGVDLDPLATEYLAFGWP
jgi:transglutaminase superfamily protein